MKTKFSEYYKLSEREIKDHWKNDIFSFDANVLLNLYRYTPSTRDAFFNLLENIQDRIWVSYQAAYEYQKNRLTVISAQKEAYKEIRRTLEQKKNDIDTKLNGFAKHPYLQASELKRQITSAFKSISKDLNQSEEKHPDYLHSDPILDRLTILLDRRVGDDFSDTDLAKLFKDGKKRYDEKIPPGYMDQKRKQNQGDRSLYGDLVVWKQVIEKAKSDSCSIIFVTDDLKEDWWYKFKGQTIGARPELLREFRDEAQQCVNIYQADKFLEFANSNLELKTNQDAIDEIRKVRMADEKDLAASDSISVNFDAEKLPEEKSIVPKSGFENSIDAHIKEVQGVKRSE